MVRKDELKKIINRVKRAPWILGQRLVNEPKNFNSSVSDLFVWINEKTTSTIFQSININKLFEQKSTHGYLYIFDMRGNFLSRKKIKFNNKYKITIDLSNLIKEDYGPYGTFAFFHGETPIEIKQSSGYITERGYVGYRNLDDAYNYVHGNHDAISLSRDNLKISCLSSLAIVARDFNLQYLIEPDNQYFFYLVNNSCKDIDVTFSIHDGLISSKIISSEKVHIHSKGVRRFEVSLLGAYFGRLVITSRLVMARPLVIKVKNNKLDCFHG